MHDITYCMNRDCPYKDCVRHIVQAPLNTPVSMAWLDGTCRRYIGGLIDEAWNRRAKEAEQNG